MTCPTCSRDVASRYCPACGERQLQPADLTFGHLLTQAIETISNTDGRVFGSIRDLAIRPGALTSAYIEGRRKPYLAPLPLFLLINVAFFAVQSLTNWRIFSTPLYSHLQQQLYSGAARALVAERLAAMQTTIQQYDPIFNQAAALNAKSLIILMVPPFALAAWLLLRRHGRPFVTHVVFALHFVAFVLLLFCVMLPIAKLGPAVGLRDSALDFTITLSQMAVYAGYLWVAIGRTYGARGLSRVFTAVALTAATVAVQLGYRFAIFLITLYAT
jgi:hypothetical protein